MNWFLTAIKDEIVIEASKTNFFNYMHVTVHFYIGRTDLLSF